MMMLSLNLLLAGLMVVPMSILYRKMEFGPIARAQVLGSLFGAIVAGIAHSGKGEWDQAANAFAEALRLKPGGSGCRRQSCCPKAP